MKNPIKDKVGTMTLFGKPIGGVNSWSFDTFENDEDRERFRKEMKDMYAEHYASLADQENIGSGLG